MFENNVFYCFNFDENLNYRGRKISKKQFETATQYLNISLHTF